MWIVTATDVTVQAPAAPDVPAIVPVSLCQRRGISRDAEQMLGGLVFLESLAAAERAHRHANGGRSDDE